MPFRLTRKNDCSRVYLTVNPRKQTSMAEIVVGIGSGGTVQGLNWIVVDFDRVPIERTARRGRIVGLGRSNGTSDVKFPAWSRLDRAGFGSRTLPSQFLPGPSRDSRESLHAGMPASGNRNLRGVAIWVQSGRP